MMDTTIGTRVPTSTGRAGSTSFEHSIGRIALLVGLFLAAWLALLPTAEPPSSPIPRDPAGAFSAQRALHDLEVITSQPRVMGTPGLVTARDYLAAQFAAIGLEPEITNMTVVRQSPELGVGILAESHDVVARLPGTDSTGAILIGGHLDTVHTTTAAGDCGGCAVSVLEIARALVSAAPLRNDVIFLIEDGEETTRAGALTFVEQHPWAKDVRVALNQEAMGTAGGSQVYVTGPQNGWLMTEALRAMPSPVAYSFVNDLVWASGTGGSDLDQFLLAAPVGLGMIHLANVSAYHTVLDNIANLDPRTLQQRGDNLVALARHFGNLPLDGTLTAPDLVYFNLAGYRVIHYTGTFGIGLALLAALLSALLIGVGIRRGRLHLRGLLIGLLVFLPCVIAVTLLNGALWAALRYLDPRLQVFLIGVSYDREWYTIAFIALGVGLTSAAYALFKRPTQLNLSGGALVWWVLLAVLTAFRLPGSSPHFAIPALLVLVPLAIVVFQRSDSTGTVYWLALGLAALGSVLILTPAINFLGIFSGRAEMLMDLPVIALLPVPLAAMLTALLLPLVGGLSVRRWVVPAVASALAVAILAGVALTAQFSEERPKPNMVAYLLEDGQAHWVSLAANVSGQRGAILDEWTGQFFPDGVEETTFSPWGASYMELPYPAYRGPAPVADLPAPQLQVISDQSAGDGVRQLLLRITAPANAPMRVLRVETEGQIEKASLFDQTLDQVVNSDSPRSLLWIDLFGFTGEDTDLALTIRGQGGVRLRVEERIYSLPELEGVVITPRPAWMIQSPTFVSDTTIVRHNFEIQ